MKNNILILFLSLLIVPGFCQNSKYDYFKRKSPAIKREKLQEAKFIRQITPEFSKYFALPIGDLEKLNQLFHDHSKIVCQNPIGRPESGVAAGSALDRSASARGGVAVDARMRTARRAGTGDADPAFTGPWV